MKAVFVTENISANSTGRTYCLWQLAKAAGWEAEVVSLRGAEIWSPLRDTDFASACSVVDRSVFVERCEAAQADVLVGVKPHPWSLGVAAETSAILSLPVIADIDDPDLEGKLSWRRPLTRSARAVLRPSEVASYKLMFRLVMSTPRSVGNPLLQRRFGGTLIPHVRAETAVKPQPRSDSDIQVAFVGTPGHHKGIGVLRRAISVLHDEGFRLVITADPPADAAPWENWIGETSLTAGQQIVADSDIVAVPSLRSVASTGQFPVKLLDAMMLKTAIVTTSVEPIPWVVGRGARIAEPGSVRSLVSALRSLNSEQSRAAVGEAAFGRASEIFSVESVSQHYERLLESVIH